MSATEATCLNVASDMDNGAGEVRCYKIFAAGCSFTNIMASELVNEMLENALNIVEDKTEEINSEKVPKISKIVVGDIIDNILSKSNDQNETALLDDEIKRIIKEMKCPSETKQPIFTKGVGDQLNSKSEIAQPSSRRNTLERKGRLTNLVQNSKHILSKIISTDHDKSTTNETSLEDSEEKCLKVTDLEGSTFEKNTAHALNGKGKHGEKDFTFRGTSMDDVDLEIDRAHGEGSSNENTVQRELDKSFDFNSKDAGGKKKKCGIGAKLMKFIKRKKEAKQQN